MDAQPESHVLESGLQAKQLISAYLVSESRHIRYRTTPGILFLMYSLFRSIKSVVFDVSYRTRLHPASSGAKRARNASFVLTQQPFLPKYEYMKMANRAAIITATGPEDVMNKHS